MSINPAILHAIEFSEKSQSELTDDKAIEKAVQGADMAWIHLDMTNPEARKWLENDFSLLDDIIVDALLAEESRPRIVEFEDGILLILRGVNLNENSEPEDMVSVRMWIDEKHIVSTRRRPLKAVIDTRRRILAGKGPRSAGEFVTSLTARMLERMEPTFTQLDETLDNLEEVIMEVPRTEERQEITSVRKKAIMFRRYIAPQRDVIARLRTTEVSWLDDTQKRRLQESLDRIIRYVEDLDTIRERAAIVKDELTTALSDRMNKNLYILSVIAAIFLPLGFLTGLLGINVGGIPGGDNPMAFGLFCTFLVTVVLIQVWLFKKMKWF